MLHKFKILLVTVLVVVFGTLGLAGCGGDKQENTSSGDSQSVSAGQKTTQDNKKESTADLFGKGQKIEGMTCDYVITSEDITAQGKMWVQGEKVKHETTAQGQKIIMIFDGNIFYSYNPDESMAIKFTNDDMQGDSKEIDTPLDFTEEASDELITELETVDYEGFRCRVLIVKEKGSKDEVKMWVREDCGIPVRVEATDANGIKTVMEYRNLKVGALPAGTFELPKGVQVQDISEMMSQMQKAGN